MAEYKVTVTTSATPNAGSFCTVGVMLIGAEGCVSEEFVLGKDERSLRSGSSCVTTLKMPGPLGPVVLVRLRKEGHPGFPDLDWHCEEVAVETPAGEEWHFPCHKWIRTADGAVELRRRAAVTVNTETLQILKDHRARELQAKQQLYRWRTFHEGLPHCIDMATVELLGPNLRYTRQGSGVSVQYVSGFREKTGQWGSLQELGKLFSLNHRNNTVACTHCPSDAFFGVQFLNGCNPLVISRCRHLPPNLPVSSAMLRPFLPEGSSLEQEMECGTIFLADYEVLEGVPANCINGQQHYLAAPLCLLHLGQQGELKPIAIQLQQQPGPLNPIFVPSDSVPDWLLAKLWVRNADFQCHQLVSHFLRTHLLGEVYCTAILRQLPEVHPLHQLLMPHVSTTLQINIQARASLLSAGGVFDRSIACGLQGVPALLRRATERLHYSSLCLPEDVQQRGLDTVPTCYFARDGLRVWNAIHRFVAGLLQVYYLSDLAVQQDSELQAWILEIFTQGFLGRPESGVPQSFQNRKELAKFITMVIFSCSALHSAVNFSQLEFNLWMPNSPPTMPQPPPTAKGTVTEAELLSRLPPINATCSVLTTLTLLSHRAPGYVPLGQYPKYLFTEGSPQRLLGELQTELKALSAEITERNSGLELPYLYLSPELIENSVAI
ncbi:LX15B lipoxygenase, partial [Amia calva]|nr:LX15B lipoxygenase [Amia calva]